MNQKEEKSIEVYTPKHINEVREKILEMIDMPSTPKNKVCKHCLEPPMYCTCIEKIIEENDSKNQ